MDHSTFDQLTRSFGQYQPRRMLVKTFGSGALAALVGRFGLADEAEARKKGKNKNKKKKKCKGNTRKCNGKCIPQDNCCIDADCRLAEIICQNGECVAQLECQNDGDCGANEVCQNGTCVPDPGLLCQGNGDCNGGEFCVEGVCVLVAGTCAATDDHCSVNESLCNPEAGNDCFCLQRFDGGAACAQDFVPGSVCGDCTNDADCAAIDEASVCVSAVAFGCPCDPGEGICARLCPNQ